MRVALLLSGGVDSSVALYMLLRAGYAVDAFYLKVWSEQDALFAGACPWRDDLYYARAICERFNVRLTVVPLQERYYEHVVAYTLRELRMGGTPSPDIFCNKYIKFGAFLDMMDGEYRYCASGHYARIRKYGDYAYIARGRDHHKDQSYFLARLSAQQAGAILFPIGDMTKREIRGRAARLGLATAGRPDSQGLCFLGATPYSAFVHHYLGARAGRIIERDSGAPLGQHRGHWFYTIGQRRGLGLADGPWYVVDKDSARNIVYVSHHRLEYRNSRVTLSHIEWNNPQVGEWACRHIRSLAVKYRHAPRMHRARLIVLPHGAYALRFRAALPHIADGQQVALYVGNRCIGCGRVGNMRDDNMRDDNMRAGNMRAGNMRGAVISHTK